MFSFLKRFDWGLFLAGVLLSAFGLLVIYSLSPATAKEQLIFFGIGIVLYFFAALLDYHYFTSFSLILYILILILVSATHFLGVTVFGSSRWLSVSGINLQPSELSKLAVILALASFLSSARYQANSLVAYLSSALIVLLPAAVVFFQPDLGTALVILAIWVGMVFTAGVNFKFIMTSLGSLVILAIPFWLVLKDYQRSRFLTFFSPTSDPLGAGYNVIQSIIAVGSGGIFGRGFGRGTQSHLKFLPARHTDFIFASLSEEWGLIGGLILLILFLFLAYRIIKILGQAPDNLGLLIAAGVLTMLFFQTTVNIGMNLGLMPITGIPLPLISSGGSSLVMTLFCLGLVQSIALRRKI
ncbi:MAG: rod shape-determining protein RodA [Patescibacteria group bacterium]